MTLKNKHQNLTVIGIDSPSNNGFTSNSSNNEPFDLFQDPDFFPLIPHINDSGYSYPQTNPQSSITPSLSPLKDNNIGNNIKSNLLPYSNASLMSYNTNIPVNMPSTESSNKQVDFMTSPNEASVSSASSLYPLVNGVNYHISNSDNSNNNNSTLQTTASLSLQNNNNSFINSSNFVSQFDFINSTNSKSNYELDKSFDQFFTSQSQISLALPMVSNSSSSTLLSKNIISNEQFFPNNHLYFNFQKPTIEIEKVINNLVKLAHRNKDTKVTDLSDPNFVEEYRLKLKKQLLLKKKRSNSIVKQEKKQRQIGRPLTPRTKIRLTLVPSLLSLYSMLVTETLQFDSSSNLSSSKNELNGKFRILKKGNLSNSNIEEELSYNDSINWKFKSNSKSFKSSDFLSDSTNGFPGKSQTVTFIDADSDSDQKAGHPGHGKFKNAIGFESGNIPIYDSIDVAVKEVFDIQEYTFLRVTRAAAFESTGSVVLKMETAKPGSEYLNDDEFDLKLILKLKKNGQANDDDFDWDLASSDEILGNPGDKVTTTFLKKKVARPRYKSNMRIYLIPRNSDVIMYTRENMLKRDLVNGTLDLTNTNDPRLIITAFHYENLLKELGVII